MIKVSKWVVDSSETRHIYVNKRAFDGRSFDNVDEDSMMKRLMAWKHEDEEVEWLDECGVICILEGGWVNLEGQVEEV